VPRSIPTRPAALAHRTLGSLSLLSLSLLCFFLLAVTIAPKAIGGGTALAATLRPGEASMSGQPGSLDLVSCPTVSFCMALGWSGSRGIVDTELNGVWRASSEAWGDPAGLSCASPTDCLALGHERINAWLYDGTSWHVALALAGSQFSSVSCQALGWCTLVTPQALYVMQGSVPTVIEISGAGSAQQYFACASPTFCLGVNSVGENPEVATAAVYGASHWARSPIPQPELDDHVSGDACVSPDRCFVVGAGYDDEDSDGVLLERLDGTTWSTPVAPDPGPSALSSFDGVTAISCSAGTGLCTSVGNDGGEQGAKVVWFVEMGSGSSWTSLLLPAAFGQGLSTQLSASCPAATFCVVAGSSRAGSLQATYLATLSHDTWTRD
jgi:hypothetical protein